MVNRKLNIKVLNVRTWFDLIWFGLFGGIEDWTGLTTVVIKEEHVGNMRHRFAFQVRIAELNMLPSFS